jgi:hypothetical protein
MPTDQFQSSLKRTLDLPCEWLRLAQSSIELKLYELRQQGPVDMLDEESISRINGEMPHQPELESRRRLDMSTRCRRGALPVAPPVVALTQRVTIHI